MTIYIDRKLNCTPKANATKFTQLGHTEFGRSQIAESNFKQTVRQFHHIDANKFQICNYFFLILLFKTVPV